MAPEKESTFCIYEARNEEMVSLEDGKSTKRLAKFLKPCIGNINQSSGVPKIPPVSQIFFHKNQDWHPILSFKGWKNPQKKWREWVDRMAGNNALIWNQTVICDAILSSLCRIPCNRDLIVGLVEYWCPETNTFVFPWGEAAITLEDVIILGGFSVLGEPVKSSLTEDLHRMEGKIKQLRIEISRSKSREPDHGSWIKFFLEMKESHELEHVGFISLWLSRFVFPSLPESIVGSHVFPIAVNLSQGKRIALAPAVLASLYKNLKLLKQKLVSISSKGESVTVLGPFQLLQMWAFERFPILGPIPNELKLGEPRPARWHKLNSNASLAHIRLVLKSAGNFQWRPYAGDLKNWCFKSLYKENEQLIVDGSSSVEELRSFAVCLCSNEIVGLYSIEKYMPHRLAMQFGMDQDLPGEFAVIQPNCMENFSVCVPAIYYRPCVSLSYHNWWKGSKLTQEKEILKPNDSQMPPATHSTAPLDTTSMLNTVMNPKEESNVFTASAENARKMKLPITEEENVQKEIKSEKAEDSGLKNDQLDFSEDKKKNIDHIRLPTEKGEEKHAIGTLSNPLYVEDYVQEIHGRGSVGTYVNPIDIDKYILSRCRRSSIDNSFYGLF